jgi:hypothetical protein
MRLTCILAVWLLAAPAIAQHIPARSRSISKRVTVDSGRSAFQVEHVWEVTGAYAAELMNVRHRLTLRGPTGLFGGSDLLRTETPPGQENLNGHVDAHFVRPLGIWWRLGSRARTRPTLYGFEASMSEGTIGMGTSQVVIGPTFERDGVAVTRIVETGEYTLHLETPALLAPLSWSWSLFALTPPGQTALYPALYGMGTLHNEVFDAGSALAGAVNLARSRR